MRFALILLAILASPAMAAAENSSTASGEPVLEAPTLRCLGAYWIIRGDDNRNARVDFEYRKPGDKDWKSGPPLFRVEKTADIPYKHVSPVNVPANSWLFAGSLFNLAPDTDYELRLKLVDPDGGAPERTLKCRTTREPVAPKGLTTYHVAPGNGGGAGTAANPFKGLDEADQRAKPGTLLLVHKGTYPAFRVSASGAPGKPVIWMGAGDGEAIIDGGGQTGIQATGLSDVWFEKLTVRNASVGIQAGDSARFVIRRCHITVSMFGINFNSNRTGRVSGFFVSDNLIEGPCTWPRKKGIETPRGIQMVGTGHDVCYNRVRNFSDAIDTYQDSVCAAIDIHNNDVSELTDDGFELDYSNRNVRCYENRITNAFQGISMQPILGGPAYVYRNAMYNIDIETFKMHSTPSGGVVVHNTAVKRGEAIVLLTPSKVQNFYFRNNLFIGSGGNRAYDCDPPMERCDFDYDGFGGGPWREILHWNKQNYRTIEDLRDRSPVEKHAVLVENAERAFASGVKAPAAVETQYDGAKIDLRLRAGTAAVDAGQTLPGLNDGYAGKAPDLGAYEIGAPLPQYGPRPLKP